VAGRADSIHLPANSPSRYNPGNTEAVMSAAITPSPAALALLRLHVERDNTRVHDANREAHRELARAGLMEAVQTFAFGRESRYRFTAAGCELAIGLSRPAQSPAESAAVTSTPDYKPIWEVAAVIRNGIPVEKWAKLPADGARQIDHYIYGTPKRPTA
jgi:hypothetical protein